MRPGVEVFTTDQPPPRSAPTDTGVWFVAGQTEKGPAATAVEIKSVKNYESTFGARAGGTVLYDSVEAYFREGGGTVWVSAIPTTPDALTLRTVDRGNAPAPPEEKKNGKSGETPGQQIAPSAAQLKDALDVFIKTMGPGQVSVPGNVDPVTQADLLDHAAANNRVALLDGLELGDAAAQTALAAALQSQANARVGALFGPWAVCPGVALGTERHIPYSAIEAGIIARNDEAAANTNIAAAGQQGRSYFSTGVTMAYTDDEYEALNVAGFDAAKMVYGEVQTYGYRSLSDPDTPDGQLWISFGHARTNMGITAEAEAIGERYVFSQIDGLGLTVAQFGGELRGMLLDFYSAGALYGATPADAYNVDVGAQVNTPDTIANGELHAVMRVRMSPFAEWVVIEIVKVATTESVALAA